MRTIAFCVSLLPCSARYRYRVEIEAQTNAPLAKGGWFCRRQNRGDSEVRRFPHGFVLLESACCGIPQARRRPPGAPRPCQFPFTREPFCARYRYCGGSGCANQSPRAIAGVVLPEAKPGDSEVRRFPHGFVLLESACCGIPQSRLTPCQLPFTREPFCARYRYCGGRWSVDTHQKTGKASPKGRLSFYSLTAPTRSIMGRRISSRIPGRDSISAGGWGSTTWARRKPFSSRVFR